MFHKVIDCCLTRELEYFFFQNLTLGYMTKTLNQIFFFLRQNQNIFFSNIGNQNIFLEKKHKLGRRPSISAKVPNE